MTARSLSRTGFVGGNPRHRPAIRNEPLDGIPAVQLLAPLRCPRSRRRSGAPMRFSTEPLRLARLPQSIR